MGFRVTIEIPLFLSFVAFFLTDSVNTNLMIYRTCYVIMGFDKHNCSLLGKVSNNITKELEKLVQPKSDVISMTKTLMDSVSSAVLCLFVGAWSDRFGRKPVLVVNLLGYTLMNLVMVVFSDIERASPWFMMTCSIPVILTGGGASLTTILSAYLTDVTSEEDRGFRMGVFEVVMATAIFIGSSSSSYVFNSTSYVAVYAIAAGGCFLALLYTCCFLPESLEVREDTGRIKGFFQMQNLSGMFRTTFRQRPHYNRAIILLIMLALALMFVAIFGDGSVFFLFTREKFQWSLSQFTWYNSASNILWITSTLFVVYVVHHKLHVKEPYLIFVGFVSIVVSQFVVGMAKVGWILYLVLIIRIPSAAINPLTKSFLSKSVDVDEAGKIFAVFSLIQNTLGLFGAPVYTTLYNATLNTDPGIFNFLSSGIHFVNTICILTVLILQKRTADLNYTTLDSESTTDGNQVEGYHASEELNS